VYGFPRGARETVHEQKTTTALAKAKKADCLSHDKERGTQQKALAAKPQQLMAHCLHSIRQRHRRLAMQQFKQTWLAIGHVSRWTLGFCVSARCMRNALRRQRIAMRQANTSAYTLSARTI
jgi:hypothetical protein